METASQPAAASFQPSRVLQAFSVGPIECPIDDILDFGKYGASVHFDDVFNGHKAKDPGMPLLQSDIGDARNAPYYITDMQTSMKNDVTTCPHTPGQRNRRQESPSSRMAVIAKLGGRRGGLCNAKMNE
jgi:hypothetical protein